MSRAKIPLYDLTVSQSARREVAEVLESGWLTTGPKAAAFENTVSRYLGVKSAAAVNSATAGLVLALQAIGIKPGSEIITTPLTFVATISSILHCGARPVLVDIENRYLTIDPAAVERAITRRTACIVPVDIAGHPCDYTSLRAIARRRKLAVISDSAHAFGAKYLSKSIPAYTNCSVYSFHSTKNLTCGEGGMVVSNNRALIERVKLLSRHAMTTNAHLRKQSGGWSYDVLDLGYKVNLSDLHAAIGLGQLKEFDREQAQRRRLVVRYDRNLSSLAEFVTPPCIDPECDPAWHLYIVKLNLKRLRIDRNEFIAHMAKRGIECGVHYRPIYEFSYYRKLGFSARHLPATAAIAPRIITLPLYARLSASEVDYVCDAIADIFKRFAR